MRLINHSIVSLFKNNRKKLCLLSFVIDFVRHDGTLRSNTSLSAVCFLNIVFVANNQYLVNIRISNHLLHEDVFILSILKTPNIQDYIYTIAHQAPSQLLHPNLILFGMPTIKIKTFGFIQYTLTQ